MLRCDCLKASNTLIPNARMMLTHCPIIESTIETKRPTIETPHPRIDIASYARMMLKHCPIIESTIETKRPIIEKASGYWCHDPINSIESMSGIIETWTQLLDDPVGGSSNNYFEIHMMLYDIIQV